MLLESDNFASWCNKLDSLKMYARKARGPGEQRFEDSCMVPDSTPANKKSALKPS